MIISHQDNSEILREVKELAKAVSTQAQVANRIWLGLMAVAVVALLPRDQSNADKLAVPFGLGPVAAEVFYVIVFFMLVVLTIAFSGAYAQQFRAQQLAQSCIDSMYANPPGYAGPHPRDWLDLLRLPTFNRVAPLAQLIKGPYQFYRNTARCPMWRRVASTVYYVLLKLTSLAVYFGLPASALLAACQRTKYAGFFRWLAIAALLLSILTLVQVCLCDILSLKKVIPRIWHGGEQN